jgi:hypothetical protein
VRHVETTTTIPAELGVKFGIRYRVIGDPDGQRVTIRKSLLYPLPGVKAPNAPRPLLRSDDPIAPTIGEIGYSGFEFDDPWELVPGVWTIQLWQGTRLLTEQRFNVVARQGV